MKLKVILKNEVKLDILEAYYWYEEQNKNLGLKFLDKFYNGLDIIQNNPEICNINFKNLRRLIIRKFPFGIYYEIEKDKILVFACLDLRRDPETIKKILEEF